MQELGIEVEEENREETDKEKMAAVLEEQYRTRRRPGHASFELL